jgi:hypothetical protein
VLALLIGGYMALRSHGDPGVPFVTWFILYWALSSLAAFVICWLVLSLIAWAFQGFAK